MKITYDNRDVEITDISGENDDDLMIEAVWLDTDEEIDDIEILDKILKENYGEIHQSWYEDKICEAEYLYDGD